MLAESEESQFLPEILARYHDDVPRLILADYLDESPNPACQARAELIRVQCTLARLAERHPRCDELLELQQEILAEHQETWAKPLLDLVSGIEFRRGLLDVVSMEAKTFITHGDKLFERAAIRRVKLIDAASVLNRLVNSPHLMQVRELDLCGNDLGNGGVNLLLRSPYLGEVRSLDLSFNDICDGGVRLLAGTRSLPKLRDLILSDNGRISGDGVRTLAQSPFSAGLRSMDVSNNDINDVGIHALTTSQYLSELHTLQIDNNHIGDAGVMELIGSPLLQRMLKQSKKLDLRRNAITPVGGKILAEATSMTGVADLDLSGNYLGDVGVGHLAESSHLTQLHTLGLGQNRISDIGAKTLAGSTLMPQLRHIDLASNRLTEDGIESLYHSRGDWRTTFELSDNFSVSSHG